MMLLAAFPVFMLTALLGGVSYAQIGRVMAVTLAAVLVCGSLGSTLALWREKTFQALAMTVLALVLWLAVGEMVAAGVLGDQIAGSARQGPGRRIEPLAGDPRGRPPLLRTITRRSGPLGSPVYLFLLLAVVISLLLNGVAIAMVRVWNPSRESDGAKDERGNDE